jgi:hypothetical protein
MKQQQEQQQQLWSAEQYETTKTRTALYCFVSIFTATW